MNRNANQNADPRVARRDRDRGCDEGDDAGGDDDNEEDDNEEDDNEEDDNEEDEARDHDDPPARANASLE
jgi:hypothetical protein